MQNVECINIFGNQKVSTPFLKTCLRLHIPVIFYSSNGHFNGKIVNPDYINSAIQRRQAILGADLDFSLDVSKALIRAKINNQISLLEHYDFGLNTDEAKSLDKLFKHYVNVENITSIDQLRGIEGSAALLYFKAVDTFLPDDMKIETRSQHPPKNRANSLLSMGYSILHHDEFKWLY